MLPDLATDATVTPLANWALILSWTLSVPVAEALRAISPVILLVPAGDVTVNVKVPSLAFSTETRWVSLIGVSWVPSGSSSGRIEALGVNRIR